MKIISKKHLTLVSGGVESTCMQDTANIIKYDNGYLKGTILVPASNAGQILNITIKVNDDTLIHRII